jgi:ABC-type sugar transport system permease subunit
MKRNEQRRFIVVFLAPSFILFTLLVAIPSVRALLYSLQKWNGLTDPEWIGLGHFQHLFSSRGMFLDSLGHNLFLTLVGGSLTILLALFFAAVLHRRVRGSAIFRVAFFFPNVIAAVAVALLWLLLYSATDFGVINGILGWMQTQAQAAGLPWPDLDLPFPFLASQHLIAAIVPMMVWMWTGFYMVLFLAGMEGIPETYYEVARLEGASAWAQFRHITLPLVREIVAVGVVFLVISAMKFFDPIWVLENQRPTKDSHVMTTLLYQKVFTEYNVGYGAAIAVLLFILVFLATLVSLRLSRAERIEY